MTLLRWPALLIAVGVFAALFFSASRIAGSIDTDIMSLLPTDTHDGVLAAAVKRANEAASNRVSFAIEGGSVEERQAARAELADALSATGWFLADDEEGEAVWGFLFASRTSLLCERDRALLEAGEGAAIAADALRQWYGPSSVGFGGLVAHDPLLLANRLAGCVLSGAPRTATGGAEILSGRIQGSVYRLDVQDDVGRAVGGWRETGAPRGLSLARGGALFHAAHGAAQARFEVSLIGGVTLAALLLLYWMMFRSFRPPVLALTMVASALVTGLAVTLLVFGSIHVMALVFGAALIGMVVDYTTYYLVTGLGSAPGTRAERRRRLLRPLTVGMATSVGAFAALLVFPVPAFQQVALFGMAGLAMAWAGTLWLVPLIEGGGVVTGPGAARIAVLADKGFARAPRPLWGAVIAALALLAALAGWRYGAVLDDVRRLQKPSPVLAAEEARLRELTGFAPSTAFILVRGDTAEAAIRNEETLIGRLAEDDRKAVLLAASRIDSSAHRRRHDADLIRKRLLGPHLRPFIAALGAGDAGGYASVSEAAEPPALVQALRGETGGVFWSILPVSGPIVLPAATAEDAHAPWSMVEPVALYTDLFGDYRRLATLAVAGALLVTALLLVLIERRAGALRALIPAFIAVLATPSLVMALGIPFSFFSAMGLFLVVGAGVDYAIFQREAIDANSRWTRVGIVLAALMTCISVGLLGFSSVLPVRSFGVTVAVGIFLSLVLSPLARRGDRPVRSGGQGGNA
jgi:predicted exporter